MFSLVPPAEPPAHWWQGKSGRWYYFWIYPLDSIPSWIGECDYIFARPRHDQTREPFYFGEKGDTDRFANHEKMNPALRLGATELHVNFSAKSRWERLDIETDLRHGHWTPLNEQPTSAPMISLASLGALAQIPYSTSLGVTGVGAASHVSPGLSGVAAALSHFLQPQPNPTGVLETFGADTGIGALARALGTTRR